VLRARGAWEETRPEVGSQRGLWGLDTLWRVKSLAREQEELSRVLCEQDSCQMGLRSSACKAACMPLSPSPDCCVIAAAAVQGEQGYGRDRSVRSNHVYLQQETSSSLYTRASFQTL
jgi:hypothetical protein